MARIVNKKKKKLNLDKLKEPMYIQMTSGAIRLKIKFPKDKFPDQKPIVLTKNNPRELIDDIKVLKYISNEYTGISLLRLNDKEFRKWASVKILPYIELKLTKDDVKKFLYKSKEEDELIKELEKRGYRVNKKEPEPVEDIDFNPEDTDEETEQHKIKVNDVTLDQLKNINNRFKFKYEQLFQFIEDNKPIEDLELLLAAKGIGPVTFKKLKNELEL